MRAYEAALEGPHAEIGATKRTRPGSLSAAIAGYYRSLEFRSFAAGTQAMRRAILERFRAVSRRQADRAAAAEIHRARAVDDETFAARNWLKTIRHLMQFASRRSWARRTHPRHQAAARRRATASTPGPRTRSQPSRRTTRSAHGAACLASLLYTALRRGRRCGDGPPTSSQRELTVRQHKTGVSCASQYTRAAGRP